jgi:hypothetical protein
MEEPGLDFHDWESRWHDLQETAADEPTEALPEIVRLVHEMLVERGYDVDDPLAAEGAEAEVVRQFVAARDLATVVERGEQVELEDVIEELDGLREVHDYLLQERTAP